MQALTTWNLEWLISPETEKLCFDRGWADLERTAIPMPEGCGQGFIELCHLGQGMDILRGTVSFPAAMAGQLVPMAVAKGSVPEPMFGVQSAKSGTVLIRERRVGVELIFHKGITFFQHVDRLDIEPVVDASEDLELTIITMGVPVLATLIGERAAMSLLSATGIEALPAASTRLVPPTVSQLLYDTLPPSLSGKMRILFSQAKTLEYLCALAVFLEGGRETQKSSSRLTRAVVSLRKELERHEGKVPSLSELARQYGASAKALNHEFRNQNGKSIYAFIADHRLTESHGVLERTDIPMKRLAANLGYSHVNHFISAFRKRFGYPPGSLRRKPASP